ncbi:MAG: prevent-host-death protein [bacterium]|jgi:prevent-host-death family protein|nr:MAG: prevent-host-death protein [bacterium]
MKVVPLSEAKAKLSKLVDQVATRDEEIVITRNGRAAAVLVSQDQYDGWRETAEILADKELMKEIRRGLRTPRKKLKRYTVAELFDA